MIPLADLSDVMPQQLADDTKKLQLSQLIAQLLEHADKPRVQNLIAAQIYALGARHVLDHMAECSAVVPS